MRTQASIDGLVQMILYIKGFCKPENMTLIEIGAFSGQATEQFCKYFNRVIIIEPWENNIGDITNKCNMEDVKKEFYKRCGHFDNLSVYKDFSGNIAHKFGSQSVDIVYIDGLHTYEAVREDIKNYFGKIKLSGFISGHDYSVKFPGVKKAVHELIGKPDKLFKDSSWIKRVA